jgi:uncharacterized membrane protein
MSTIEARVIIQRPIEQVFAFYRDPANMPSFLGDVMASEVLDPATFRWTIQGPLGIRVHSTMRVTEERTNELIRYETVGTPGLAAQWEISFAAGSTTGETEVRSKMKTPLGKLGIAALALLGKYPAEEQSANLRRLKQILETGRVTDTSYAVAGKFGSK